VQVRIPAADLVERVARRRVEVVMLDDHRTAVRLWLDLHGPPTPELAAVLAHDAVEARVNAPPGVLGVQAAGAMGASLLIDVEPIAPRSMLLSDALAQMRSRGEEVEPGLTARVLRSVAEAISALHATGRVHGAVDSSAVLIEGGGLVRLIGTGQAALDALLKPPGPTHPAPVAIAGRPAADVYGLAAIACELLGDRDAPPAHPAAHLSNPAPSVQAVLHRGLATAERLRFPNPDALSRELARVLGQPEGASAEPLDLTRWLATLESDPAHTGPRALLGHPGAAPPRGATAARVRTAPPPESRAPGLHPGSEPPPEPRLSSPAASAPPRPSGGAPRLAPRQAPAHQLRETPRAVASPSDWAAILGEEALADTPVTGPTGPAEAADAAEAPTPSVPLPRGATPPTLHLPALSPAELAHRPPSTRGASIRGPAGEDAARVIAQALEPGGSRAPRPAATPERSRLRWMLAVAIGLAALLAADILVRMRADQAPVAELSVDAGPSAESAPDGGVPVVAAPVDAGFAAPVEPEVAPAVKPLRLLTVMSSPPGASVEVDGGFVGRTPLVMPHQLLPGAVVTVRVLADGYAPWERPVVVDPRSGALSVSATLEPR
jgi:hypothetical protein